MLMPTVFHENLFDDFFDNTRFSFGETECVHSERLSGEPYGSPFALPPEHATVIAPFVSNVNRRVLKFIKE